MYKFAINRPITILMAVLSLIIFGMMSYNKMPVNLFPNIDFPLVTIQTAYDGADAASVESKVTDKIEEAVSGIDGIDKITSSSYEGLSIILIQFDLERDITECANDVRDKIGALKLPNEVDKPVVKKVDTGGSIINLFAASKSGDMQSLMLLADEKLKPKLQRVRNVGEVNIIGYRSREIRIFADPFLLNKYNISVSELQNAIALDNYKASAGKLINDKQEIIINAKGNARSIHDLQNMIIKPGIRLKDIAAVEDGLSDEKSYSELNGEHGVMLEVKKISGTNALDIIAGIKAVMPHLEQIAGEDYTLTLVQDQSNKILVNLHNVEFDLIFGALLAIMIRLFVFKEFDRDYSLCARNSYLDCRYFFCTGFFRI